jgi:DNA mismatch repair protein MutS
MYIMALVQEYLSLTNEYKEKYGENTLVLMQVGAFFEVYGLKLEDTISGSSIIDFTTICELNIADKKMTLNEYQVMMAGFSHYMIDKYLKKLQDAGFTIVVYTQDEHIKTKRSLSCIYSPGTYFSNDNVHITNNTTSIWVNVVDTHSSSTTFKKMMSHPITSANNKIIHVGISNIDILTGKTHIFEFKEVYIRSPTTFDELERFISIYSPSEVILIVEGLDDFEIENIIQYAGIQCLTIHRINLSKDKKTIPSIQAVNSEKQRYQVEVFSRFYHENELHMNENIYAIQSFCYLLDFIYQHNPSLVNKVALPIFENYSDRLILANHSLKQLNIIQDNHYRGKYSSIETFLNQCNTAMGRRQFSYHLLNPTTNIVQLEKEYDMTQLILTLDNVETIRKELKKIKDLSKINRQIIIRKVTPHIFSHLYSNLNTISDLFLQLHPKVQQYLVEKVEPSLQYYTIFEELKHFITSHLKIELCENIDTLSNCDINFLQKGVDPPLDELSEKLQESQEKLECIRQYLNQIIGKYESNDKQKDYVKIHESEKTLLNLIATKRRCAILKKELTKSTILHYGKDHSFLFDPSSVSFTTQAASNENILIPQVVELCKNIINMKSQIKEQIFSDYLKYVVDIFSQQYSDKLEKVVLFVTYLDIIYTRTYIAEKYHYCRPTIDETAEKSFFQAKGMRHPLIEHLQQNEIYVPNDIEVGIHNTDGMLLYGTNAVGKTSLIRSVGIILIMAQAGLYVPCSSFCFQPYKYIFTRILGNDNIFKGLSTFAVEMSELRTILQLSNKNSLILGDELCSGTESISAKSIFVAGILDLLVKRTSFLFATHLHEIVNYDEIRDATHLTIKHLAVIYDRENQLLIYDRKIRDGPGCNMYGLEVCRSLHLPEEFIHSADELRKKYHPSSDSLLSSKTSKYNSKKVRNMCEICKVEMSTEVHHLIPQKMADSKGFIRKKDGTIFHKNHLANLKSVCEKCHRQFHDTN